jgi:hypothetical protein
MRLAGDAISRLSKGAWEQFQRQNRVTHYFDKKEEVVTRNNNKPQK